MADFGFHKLCEDGQERAKIIAIVFEELVVELDRHFYDQRTKAICMTKLEEACFFAKKSMALNPDNQDNA